MLSCCSLCWLLLSVLLLLSKLIAVTCCLLFAIVDILSLFDLIYLTRCCLRYFLLEGWNFKYVWITLPVSGEDLQVLETQSGGHRPQTDRPDHSLGSGWGQLPHQQRGRATILLGCPPTVDTAGGKRDDLRPFPEAHRLTQRPLGQGGSVMVKTSKDFSCLDLTSHDATWEYPDIWKLRQCDRFFARVVE
jgi:hypothetical protein